MTDKPILMKGETFKKYGHKVKYPVFVEAKYDGIRARIWVNSKGELQVESYARKPLNNVPLHGLTQLFKDYKLTEMDVEFLVNHDFNSTYRYVRSKSVPADLIDATFQFILLDLPDHPSSYGDDKLTLFKEFYKYGVDTPIRYVAANEAEVMRVYARFRSQGLEGVMVKEIGYQYTRKRSRSWLKLKPEETYDGKIVALNRAISIKGEPLNRVGSITVQLEDGSYASPAGLAHGLGEDMYDNPKAYVGRWVEFKCMERDRAGGYRHPFFSRFREDKC